MLAPSRPLTHHRATVPVGRDGPTSVRSDRGAGCRLVAPRVHLTRVPEHARPGVREEVAMLYWSVVFFVLALIAAIFGFGGIAAGAATIGKILFVGFLALAVLSLVTGRRPTSPT